MSHVSDITWHGTGRKDFIDGLFQGKQGTEPYPKMGLPAIATQQAWDGKDAPVASDDADDDLMAEFLAEQAAKEAEKIAEDGGADPYPKAEKKRGSKKKQQEPSKAADSADEDDDDL
jgi:hypothetical protein|eukprot:SAG25_NODE_1269_length_3443_cov_1.767344_2_plen_117_part_00